MKEELTFDYAGEKFSLKSALVSGRDSGFFNDPISVYFGPLDLDDIHTALYYTNRTVIKLLKSEFGIALEDCDEFLISALSEALTKEWNIKAGGNEDVDVNKRIIKRGYNQN